MESSTKKQINIIDIKKSKIIKNQIKKIPASNCLDGLEISTILKIILMNLSVLLPYGTTEIKWNTPSLPFDTILILKKM